MQNGWRPAPAHNYGDHYFGYRLRALPVGYSELRIGNHRYFFHNGVYYRRYWLGGYMVCRPPVGTVISNTLLNVALTAATINAYERAADRIAQAVALSNAYAVANTNRKYTALGEQVYVNNVSNQLNQQYYYQDGVFYTLSNGQYYVIEAPIGALVTEIPDDYEELVLNGVTYYLVENTLYKVTVIEGALYFEVVSIL